MSTSCCQIASTIFFYSAIRPNKSKTVDIQVDLVIASFKGHKILNTMARRENYIVAMLRFLNLNYSCYLLPFN